MELYQLTAKEAGMVTDAELLLTKNRIIGKVYELFGVLQETMAADPVIGGMEVPGARPAKISRGEQYEGLPYVILDYPRAFSKDNIFACRTFFWWGRFFSITLHLSGAPLETYRQGLLHLRAELAEGQWSVCVQNDPWEHHFREDNYQPVSSITGAQWEELAGRPFLKLAKLFDLEDWEKIIFQATVQYAVLLELLKRGTN